VAAVGGAHRAGAPSRQGGRSILPESTLAGYPVRQCYPQGRPQTYSQAMPKLRHSYKSTIYWWFS